MHYTYSTNGITYNHSISFCVNETLFKLVGVEAFAFQFRVRRTALCCGFNAAMSRLLQQSAFSFAWDVLLVSPNITWIAFGWRDNDTVLPSISMLMFCLVESKVFIQRFSVRTKLVKISFDFRLTITLLLFYSCTLSWGNRDNRNITFAEFSKIIVSPFYNSPPLQWCTWSTYTRASFGLRRKQGHSNEHQNSHTFEIYRLATLPQPSLNIKISSSSSTEM